MKEPLSTYELIKNSLRDKSSLKQDVFELTHQRLEEFRIEIEKLTSKLNDDVHSKDSRLTFDTKVKGDFEIEVKLASDILFFQMHTNIFLFDSSNALWKTSYLKEDATRAYCGIINVYNCLADSIKYNRLSDTGYLIARIFINKDNHFMIQGKRQLGFLYNDFMNSKLTIEKIGEIIQSIYLYTIEFDLLTTSYNEISEVSVMVLKELSENPQLKTGKRLGFKFQADNDEIE